MVKIKKSNQSKHDKLVKKIAEGYKAQGYKVAADLKGYPRPRNMRRHRADVIAKKGKDKVIVEVETPMSMKKDKRQREALRKYASKNKFRFRTKTTR